MVMNPMVQTVKDHLHPRNRTNGRTYEFHGPRKNLSSHSSIATYSYRGPLGFGPIQFLME